MTSSKRAALELARLLWERLAPLDAFKSQQAMLDSGDSEPFAGSSDSGRNWHNHHGKEGAIGSSPMLGFPVRNGSPRSLVERLSNLTRLAGHQLTARSRPAQ